MEIPLRSPREIPNTEGYKILSFGIQTKVLGVVTGIATVMSPKYEREAYTWKASKVGGTWKITGSGAKTSNGRPVPNIVMFPFSMNTQVNRGFTLELIRWLSEDEGNNVSDIEVVSVEKTLETQSQPRYEVADGSGVKYTKVEGPKTEAAVTGSEDLSVESQIVTGVRKAVCNEFGISDVELDGTNVERKVVVYLLTVVFRFRANKALASINKNVTITVAYQYKSAVEGMITHDPYFKGRIDRIKLEVKALSRNQLTEVGDGLPHGSAEESISTHLNRISENGRMASWSMGSQHLNDYLVNDIERNCAVFMFWLLTGAKIPNLATIFLAEESEIRNTLMKIFADPNLTKKYILTLQQYVKRFDLEKTQL